MIEIFKDIVPAGSMGIEVEKYTGDELELSAPLGKNINDKGTAFAGSIYSLQVLAGWGLVTLVLKDHGIEADVMIATSSTDYTAPARYNIGSRAKVQSQEDISVMLESIRERGKGKLKVSAELLSDNKVCATFSGLYVVRLRN